MSDSASSNRPLAGLRVIDIATYIAAPYCATLMAEFGAEVIKVEQPKVGDPCRRLCPHSHYQTGDGREILSLVHGLSQGGRRRPLRHHRQA